MLREKIVTALDVGSSVVRVGCALFKEGSSPRLIGVGQASSVGVRRGQIVDIVEVVLALKEAFREAERTSEVKISKAVVAIGGPQVELMKSGGSVVISRADGEVSPDDINRVLDSSKAVSIPQNKQIIHTIPLSYSVDNDLDIEDPLGMKGVRLEVNTLLVLASHPVLRAVTKALETSEKQVEKWIYEPFAIARAILSKKQQEVGVVLVNIGGAMTEISIIKERELIYTAMVPLGGSNITYDVAIGLKTTIDVAERVKTEYGSCYSQDVSKREQVVLADWGLEDVSISRYALSQIIENRCSTIFGEVHKEIKKFIKEENLPGGIVFTGGGAKLSGIVKLAKREFKLPVQIGRVKEIESDLSEAFDPSFSTIVGSILWSHDNEDKSLDGLMDSSGIQNVLAKVWEWIKELLP
jgi:cell division protein FtsA